LDFLSGRIKLDQLFYNSRLSFLNFWIVNIDLLSSPSRIKKQAFLCHKDQGSLEIMEAFTVQNGSINQN